MKPRMTGGRDKTGHPAHAHNSKKKEKNADQDSEGRSERIKVRSTLDCDGADGQRGDQTSGGIWSDDELTRRAEYRVGE